MSTIFKNSPKLKLSYYTSIKASEAYSNLNENFERKDPLLNLVADYDDIKNIMQFNEFKIEYLYFNMKKIHEILYEKEENIIITEQLTKNFVDYYYLYNLIMDQREIINYKFENIKIIKNAFDDSVKYSDIKKIIYYKIILTLIEYMNNDEYQDEQIINECEDFKKKCINELELKKNELKKYTKNIKVDEIGSDNDITVDEIYGDILKSLIINYELNESTETIELLKELDVKNIGLNKRIFDCIKDVFDMKNLDHYNIETMEDLFKKENIIFYSVLFQYILKTSDYVYQIDFLNQVRKNIIDIINKDLVGFDKLLKANKKSDSLTHNKLKDVLNFFIIKYDYYRVKASEASKKKEEEEKNLIKLDKNNDNNNINNNQNKKLIHKESIESINSSNSISKSDRYSIGHKDDKSSSNLSSRSSSSGSKSGSNPFDQSSYRNKDNNNNFFGEDNEQNYEVSQNEEAQKILQNSEFILKVRYDKESQNVTVNYTIKYDDKKIEGLENISNMEIIDSNLRVNFDLFLNFLENVEKEIKSSYRREEEIKIKLEITSENNDYNNVKCRYDLDDGGVNDDYIDKNILEKNNSNNNLAAFISDNLN